MIFLIHHIRKIIYGVSITLWLGIFLYVTQTIPSPSLQQIRLAELFAFTAITYIYIALLASPLFSAFPTLKIKPVYIRARRAIGLSGYFFALTHAYFAFFDLLGGFRGLSFLPSNYLIAISFSFTALVILSLMAATSFDTMVKKLGKYWKPLHRLVYLAALFITIHALMLGTHFSDLSTFIPKIFFIAVAVLLILESLRLDKYLSGKFPTLPRFGISSLLVVGIIVYLSFYLRSTASGTASSGAGLNVHAAHIQLAEQAQNANTNSANLPNIPGLQGDRNKRFTVSFDHPDKIAAGENVPLKFTVYDASSGNKVSLFQRPYEKFFHLIVVDSGLTYFNHIHPDIHGSEFDITTSFPKEGAYHLYVDFQPAGAIEQQMAFTLNVGNAQAVNPNYKVDKNLTKVFGNYSVTLKTSSTLSANKMTTGQQTLSFTVKDAKTGKGITDIKPYLNSFGHLVMIKQESYDYLHVHPNDLTVPLPNANGGPTITFLPIGIYGPIKAGIYRVFAEFNINGQLTTFDFTINVGT